MLAQVMPRMRQSTATAKAAMTACMRLVRVVWACPMNASTMSTKAKA